MALPETRMVTFGFVVVLMVIKSNFSVQNECHFLIHKIL